LPSLVGGNKAVISSESAAATCAARKTPDSEPGRIELFALAAPRELALAPYLRLMSSGRFERELRNGGFFFGLIPSSF
jgi:hypothetical protein